jgi:hypothetical protein
MKQETIVLWFGPKWRTRLLVLAFLFVVFLIIASFAHAAPNTFQAERYAWELSGNGTKSVECYFWVTKTEVSTVACHALNKPTDEIAIIVPMAATDFYHTHPVGFPNLSAADKQTEKKVHIKIHVIYR